MSSPIPVISPDGFDCGTTQVKAPNAAPRSLRRSGFLETKMLTSVLRSIRFLTLVMALATLTWSTCQAVGSFQTQPAFHPTRLVSALCRAELNVILGRLQAQYDLSGD